MFVRVGKSPGRVRRAEYRSTDSSRRKRRQRSSVSCGPCKFDLRADVLLLARNRTSSKGKLHHPQLEELRSSPGLSSCYLLQALENGHFRKRESSFTILRPRTQENRSATCGIFSLLGDDVSVAAATRTRLARRVCPSADVVSLDSTSCDHGLPLITIQ